MSLTLIGSVHSAQAQSSTCRFSLEMAFEPDVVKSLKESFKIAATVENIGCSSPDLAFTDRKHYFTYSYYNSSNTSFTEIGRSPLFDLPDKPSDPLVSNNMFFSLDKVSFPVTSSGLYFRVGVKDSTQGDKEWLSTEKRLSFTGDSSGGNQNKNTSPSPKPTTNANNINKLGNQNNALPNKNTTQGNNTPAPTTNQNNTVIDREILKNPSKFESLPELAFGILNYVFMFIGVAAVIMIIYGGFMMVLSAGNEERLNTGKKTIFWAIGGLITALMAFSIVAIIQNLLGS